jgi:hypothetical protein
MWVLGLQSSVGVQAQDRVAALPALERLCENSMLASSKDVAGLEIFGTNLPDFCRCVSTQLISQFSDPEVAAYARAGQLPARMNHIWQRAGTFCKATLMQMR